MNSSEKQESGTRQYANDHAKLVKDIEVPGLISPIEEMDVTDVGVQFYWNAAKDSHVLGYQLQYDRKKDFCNRHSILIQNLLPSDGYTYLPEEVFEPGKWFWRMRTMTCYGKFSLWSQPRSFFVHKKIGREKRDLSISREQPLFILLCGHKLIVKNWQSIPSDLKPFCILRVCPSKLGSRDEFISFCKVAQKNNIPILIQPAGPHEIWDKVYYKLPLCDIEYLFQEFPVIKGAMIVEQTCQGGKKPGIKNAEVARYLTRLIRLAAAYGKTTVWADAHAHGNNLWVDAILDAELYQTIKECRDYLVPTWKMCTPQSQYLTQGVTYGLWLTGDVSNWGINAESYYWEGAGFKELNEQNEFWHGDYKKCPETLNGQMIALGLSAGATIYSFEPDEDIWSGEGKLSSRATRVIFPLLSRIQKSKLILGREDVKKKVKIGYIANEEDAEWDDIYPAAIRRIYQGTYGIRHPFQMIPSNSKYFWIPVISKYTAPETIAELAGLINGKSFTTPEEAKEYFDREYREELGGSAWSAKVGSLAIVVHSHENKDIKQDFSIPLDGVFSKITGEIEVNSYFIIQQKDGKILDFHLNGRKDREAVIRIFLGKGDHPEVKITPSENLISKSWEDKEKCLCLRGGFSEGFVEFQVQVL